jgi:hypothetical protein
MRGGSFHFRVRCTSGLLVSSARCHRSANHGWLTLDVFSCFRNDLVALSIIVLRGEAGLGKIYYLSENLLLAYYGLSLSLSVLTTVLIAVRLYIHKRELERMFGEYKS